ncbi:MAG: Alanine racemase 1 [Eubacteriales bacterium SKADARSKE-1]|nr:Alanine racemase 1 [Eubacteriales bacterium SKADARSKE-1]
MGKFFRRTWAQINLDAIENNYYEIKKNINKNSKVLCVLKADAYGHGAAVLAREYEKMGVNWFAVSNLEEALQLRYNGAKKNILILGYTPASMASTLAKFNISQNVFSEKYAKDLSDFAVKNNVVVNIHVKIDTGMSRLGFVFHDKIRDIGIIDSITKISKFDGLKIQGIFTHFPTADEGGIYGINTKLQFDNFMTAIEKLKEVGINIPIKHCSNSASILNYPEMNLDLVRAGLILYGLYPSDYQTLDLKLQRAMELKTVVSQIKEVEKQTAVSYGSTFITNKLTKVATVPIGYADGYLRCFSGRAEMLVCGKRAPVIGRVCMDQLMLDVTDIDGINENSEVTVFGTDGDETITIEELAKISNTINYELLCLLSKRVPRIYIKDGKQVEELNYICPSRD